MKNNLFSIIGTCRSGTTALLRAFTNHPSIIGISQPIKESQRDTGIPDYSIYDTPDKYLTGCIDKPDYIVFKETVGHSKKEDCSIALFRSDEDIINTRPCFILREPCETFASWKKLGWVSLENFCDSYTHVFDMIQRTKDINAPHAVITHKCLTNNPQSTFKRISDVWGIEYSDKFVSDFEYPFDQTNPRFLFISINPNDFKEAFAAVSESQKIGGNDKKRDTVSDILSHEEICTIQSRISPLYREIELRSEADIKKYDVSNNSALDSSREP